MTKKEAIQTLHDYRTWCLGKEMPKEEEVFQAIDVVTECFGFKSDSGLYSKTSGLCSVCRHVLSDKLVDGVCSECRYKIEC